MATNNESNSGLWFLIGAVIVAVAAIVWYLNAGGAPAGGTNVTVEAPAVDGAGAPVEGWPYSIWITSRPLAASS